MLMTEDWESGLEAGNILEVHLKTMKKHIESGIMVFRYNLEKIVKDCTEDQEQEDNSGANPKPSGSGIKRQMEQKKEVNIYYFIFLYMRD